MRPCNRQGTGKEVVIRMPHTGSWRVAVIARQSSSVRAKRMLVLLSKVVGEG
jgi:hypothetical protein